MKSQLKFIALGGMGAVTQNMYVYEYEDEILLVDCGIGFPDINMLGVDIVIPDISYVLAKLEQGKKIVGMILSHGHDDHIAATPYILPELPEFPIYASPLTAGFAENRMRDGGVERKINVISDTSPFEIGTYFTARAIPVTHSVPDTRHYLIKTPVGAFYHGSDFKLDPTPVDNQMTDFATITEIAKEKVLCMLVDCLRVERTEWTKSETTVGPIIEQEMMDTKGKFIITLMSSHIHRIQQVINAAAKQGRKVVFVGRSVEQNVEIASQLGKLTIDRGMWLDKRRIGDTPDKQLCIVIAGSQGQEGSSLVRAIYGDHPVLQIKTSDKVVFSADAIPGNEIPFYQAIDELFRNGVRVVYPEIRHDIHQSGHASAPEQVELVGLVKPQYVMPIGGSDRHRFLFIERVAKVLGMTEEQVVLPGTGEVVGFSENGGPEVVDRIALKPRTVDGLGIGDVGPVVLSDRRALSQAGMIVVVIPRVRGRFDLKSVEVVSRGFVFMKEADEVINFIMRTTAETISALGKKVKDEEVKRAVEKQLARKLYKIIQREPVIVPMIIDV